MVRFARNKSSVNKLDGLFYIRTWPLTLPVTLLMISQGHILKLPYLQNICPVRTKKIKRGWNPWMLWYFVDQIWSTFCFRHMLQYRSGVTFLPLTTSVWSYHYRNGDGVYLGHNTCYGPVLGFTPYTLWSCMRFALFEVTRTNVWF